MGFLRRGSFQKENRALNQQSAVWLEVIGREEMNGPPVISNRIDPDVLGQMIRKLFGLHPTLRFLRPLCEPVGCLDQEFRDQGQRPAF